MEKDILMIPEGIIKINKEKLERSVSIQYITGIIFFKTYTHMRKIKKKSSYHIFIIFLKLKLSIEPSF